MTTSVIRCAEDVAKLEFGRPAGSDAHMLRELVESDVVSADAIRDVVTYRRQHNTDLLDAIEQLDVVNEQHRPELIAKKLGIPFVRIDELSVDPAIVELLPANIAIRHRVFPIGRANGYIIIAASSPADRESITAATFAIGHPIEVVATHDRDIQKLIDAHFLLLEEQNLISELGDDDAAVQSIQGQKQADIETLAQQKPIVRLVDAIIRRAIRMRASDINIRPLEHGASIYYRIDGQMMWQRVLPPDLLPPIICRLKIMSGMNIAEHRLPQDGHASMIEGQQAMDLRLSLIPTVTGESMVIRILNRSAANVRLDDLGIAEADGPRLQRILAHTFGIFLVTGPTGSGKSTTLYAVINKRLESNPHIITVEDPVEYRIDGVEQIQIKPAIGYTFARALRHILRHDPDEVLIGEMRDYETAEIAVKAALTGHFVMSTLHTNDAASAMTRLQDMGLEPYLISSAVVGIMAQRLARRLCAKCKVVDDGSQDLRSYFQLATDAVVYRGAGCAHCNQTGYHGRVMVGELIEMTNRLREMIDQKADAESLRNVAVAEGMTPLAQNGLTLALQGITSLEEVFAIKLD